MRFRPPCISGIARRINRTVKTHRRPAVSDPEIRTAIFIPSNFFFGQFATSFSVNSELRRNLIVARTARIRTDKTTIIRVQLRRWETALRWGSPNLHAKTMGALALLEIDQSLEGSAINERTAKDLTAGSANVS
jgi:hypothetical protein